MKTTHLAFIIAALAATTYGGDAKVTLDSSNGSSAFLVRDAASNELARVQSDGKVGIGTTTPAATLDVRGASGTTLKVVDGNQAAGKVLTSDAAGNASWQTAVAGTVKYIQLTMSANQGTLYNGYGVNFDTVFRSNGMTAAGNCINLKAGVTYRVEAGLDIYAATDLGYLGYTIVNAAGVSLGSTAYAMNPISPSADAMRNNIVVIYTPSVDENIFVKITDQRMGTGQIRTNFNPYFIATEMTSAGGGAVTSVSATGPLASSGGATPTLSIQAASGSQAGALAAADWTTFNAKVGGSGTASYVPKFTASGTVGDSALFSDASGKVGIGTASPAEKLDISGNIRIPNNSSFVGASGSGDSFAYNNGTFNGTLPRYSLSWVNLGSTAEAVMSAVGGIKLLIGAANTGAYVDGTGVHNYSDVRLKNNIAPMRNMLEKVLQMQGVTFNLIVNDQASFGFIAQDLEKIFPLAVNTGTDSYKSVNYAAMTSVLVEAVKELKSEKDAEIDALKAEKDAEIAALKADNDTLKAQNAAITTQNAAILKRLDVLEAK